MRAPAFWANPPERPGWQAVALAPAAALWKLAATLRRRRSPPQAGPVPVICVGNLTAGGAGKTPMVLWLVERLRQEGWQPHILSRGYGGQVVGPHRVQPEIDLHTDVGDEPLLLAASAPVWVARDRAAGAQAAAAEGADVVVMDDGLQNPSPVKDAAVVVVDAGQGFGNGQLIPAGPLREPVEAGLARAEAVVLVGEPAAREEAQRRWPELARVAWHAARLVPRRTGLSLQGERVLAFAGIGRPEKFFETLEGLGAEIVRARPFPDHHVYSEAVLGRLARDAAGEGAMLVTTEKDAVRLPAAFRREVVTVPVALVPDEADRLMAAIRPSLRSAARRGPRTPNRTGETAR